MIEVLPETILYPDAFWRSPPAAFDGLFHWEYINEVLQPIRGIQCADVDAMVEIKGLFLSIETKDSGVPIPTGQQLRTNALLRTGLVTHLDIWGKKVPTRWRLQTGGGVDEIAEAADGREQIAARISQWAHWADRLPLVARDYRFLMSAWRCACPSARELFAKDCLNPSLGAFAATPLGQAALVRAEILGRL